MPALFIFLFKVNAALLLFCAGYYLVLRHLTFYSLNRVYLLTAIIFASLYPKIDLTAFAQRHENITKPVRNVVLIWEKPAKDLTADAHYWQYAEMAFWIGAALLAMRLAMQLFSLFKLYRNSKPAQLHNHEVRLMDSDAAPFSFWQSIYVNPANHTPADLEAILLHEQVHVNGWHTIDILLAELSSIFYWFNPGIWLIKKAVRENIEFITDRKILNKGFDSKTYQYSLVNVSFNNTTPGIVNHFNISTIKKRIIMMNKKRSSRANLTRYVFVVPVVVTLLLVFTLSKAEVAKPITLKITNAIKPVTTAISNAAENVISDTKKAINGTATLTKKDTMVKSTITLNTSVATNGTKTSKDTIIYSSTYNKPDSAKKVTSTFRTNGIGADSMNLVLNGKKIKSNDFKNIDPEKITAINIVSHDIINDLLGANNGLKFDNSRQVMFITTNDSEEGKKLMAKLGNRRQLTNIRINGVNNAPGSLNSEQLTLVQKTKNAISKANGEGLTYVANTTTYPAGNDVYKINTGTTATALIGKKINADSATVSAFSIPNGQGVKAVTANIDGPNTVVLFKNNPPVSEVKSWNIKFQTNTVTPVELSNKVYIINGKEATEKEMKKISAFDIDRIKVSTDTAANKKYGDKAKNGVVYIYTKKGK